MSPARAVRWPVLALLGVMLVAGLAGGLVRAGVALPAPLAAALPGGVAALHAALMVGAVLGTVIGIERAVALRARLAWTAPLLSLAGGVLLLAGQAGAAALAGLAAALAFTGVNLALWRRQPAPHTALLGLAALMWVLAQARWATGSASPVSAWMAFLLLTIAAERLEMARLLAHGPAVRRVFAAVAGLLAAGAAAEGLAPAVAGPVFGAGVGGLALWLLRHDIARRTRHGHGLARYMAWCLLGGYAWLALGGLAWIAWTTGLPGTAAWRDTALHAVTLGFVLSMVMAHLPVILPAVAGLKLLHGPAFAVPPWLLHLSLAWRLGASAWRPEARAEGALLNALALAAFAAVVAGAALAWRRRHGGAHAAPAAPGARPARRTLPPSPSTPPRA